MIKMIHHTHTTVVIYQKHILKTFIKNQALLVKKFIVTIQIVINIKELLENDCYTW